MKQTILKTFTVLWLFAMYLVLLFTFIAAYQSPDKAVAVTINQYSEAQLELFILLLSLFLSTVGILYLLTDIRNNLNQRVLKRMIDERF
jgi:hypothetical protein